MFDIVCYLGGTCGDLLTAVIDSRDCSIGNGKITLTTERQRLKKSWQFETDIDRNLYIDQISKLYHSIPSHDVDYHLREHHSFVAIGVSTESTALWASKRFKELHKQHVWDEMKSVNQADTIKKYAQDMLDWSSWIKTHTNRIIYLEDILNGCLEQKISSIIAQDTIDINLYHRWLEQQT